MESPREGEYRERAMGEAPIRKEKEEGELMQEK